MGMSKAAFEDGLKDGFVWDLSGFESTAEAARTADGWDTATINAMGAAHCAKNWGVSEGTDAFSAACSEYTRGVLTALKERADDERRALSGAADPLET